MHFKRARGRGRREKRGDVMTLREETRDALEELDALNDITGTRFDGLEEQVPRIEGLVGASRSP
jgi:hypothetical protein